MADDVVKLADFSPLVPDDVKALVEAKKAEFIAGTTDAFCGPIYNQAGDLVVAEGECVSDADQLSMNWFVQGVVGTIPTE